MIVSFCGHKNVVDADIIKKKIIIQAEKLINQGANIFLLGGYGNFDLTAALAVKELKTKYPHIKSVLILPYPDRKYDKNLYDCSEYPPLENVVKRYAIIKRNEYMIDSCDVVIAFIDHNFGGAYKTYTYARKKKKTIIMI